MPLIPYMRSYTIHLIKFAYSTLFTIVHIKYLATRLWQPYILLLLLLLLFPPIFSSIDNKI